MKKYNIFLICLLLAASALAQDTVQKVIPNRKNSIAQQKKPYVILISADGFRYDYAKKYNAQNLLNLSSKGVQAAKLMVPISWPIIY